MWSHLNIFFSVFLISWGAKIPPSFQGLMQIPEGKIVGGTDTTIEQFPHQISLKYFGSHRCGGSIIRMQVILTAAHCVSAMSTTYLAIVAGTPYREGEGVEDTIKEIIVHEDFDPFSYSDDIALLVLVTGLDFTDLVQPISLASLGEVPLAGSKASVIGWGTLRESGSLPDILQLVYVSIVNNADCQAAYDGKANVTAVMLCAGEPFGGRDACQGDSGGPLIIGSKQYGVVSWGIGCARVNYPGVYASVGSLRGWIDNKLKSIPAQ